jgi:photosystem II stability/assembly factor-like uncharacterized protein
MNSGPISFVTPRHGWLLAEPVGVRRRGIVLETRDGGSHWHRVFSSRLLAGS